MNLKERIEKLLEPLGYKRADKGYGAIRIEDTPGTMWALKFKEQSSVTKAWTEGLAYSFTGPRSKAYVKYVDARVYDKLVPAIFALVDIIETQKVGLERCCHAVQPSRVARDVLSETND